MAAAAPRQASSEAPKKVDPEFMDVIWRCVERPDDTAPLYALGWDYSFSLKSIKTG